MNPHGVLRGGQRKNRDCPHFLSVLRNALVVILLTLVLAAFRIPYSLDPDFLGIAIFLAFLAYLGFLFFLLSLKTGKVGVVVPVVSAQIIISSLIGFLFFDEVFEPLKIFSVGIVCLGIILTSINFKDLKNSSLFSMESGIPYAILAALFWGVAFPYFSLPSKHLGAFFYALLVEIVVLCSALIHIFLKTRLKFLNTWVEALKGQTLRSWLVIGVLTVLSAIGSVFLNLAYETGQVSLVSALQGSSSIISIITAAFLYKEILSKQQYIGATLTVVGILLPVFFS